MVRIDKEKPNSQTHYVRIRDDSILLAVIQELDYFRKSFSSLIDASKRVIMHLEPWNKDWFSEEEEVARKVRVALETLFQHSVGIYVLLSLFVWPQEVPDKRTLDRLYAIVFETIK